MLLKGIRADLKGKGIGLLPLYSSLGGRGGANIEHGFRFRDNPTGVLFEPPVGKRFDFLDADHDEIELLEDMGALVGDEFVAGRMLRIVQRYNNGNSCLIWGDGSGCISKGDGAYVISGTVITLKNRNSSDFWEIGDRISFIDPAVKSAADRGAQPATRAFAVADPALTNGFLEITAVDRDAGTVTVNVAVTDAIPTATNADWIGPTGEFGGTKGTYQGFDTWAPRRTSDAVKDLFGVQTAVDPSRLAGNRVQISLSDTPYAIIGKIALRAARAIGPVIEGDNWCCFVPVQELPQLNAELASRQIQYSTSMVGGNGVYAQTLSMGVAATEFVMPGYGPIKVIADPYLVDHSVIAEEDRTYRVFREGECYFGTTKRSFAWRDFDNQGGPLHQISGEPNVYGQYGSLGNFYVVNPGHCTTASPQALS